MEEEFITIVGSVENIVYSNSDTGFCVIDLGTDDELITVVGSINAVSVGEELKLTGSFVNHKTFGRQFKAQYFERSLPANENAIRKYLSSGIVKGIGPKIADRIVDRFKDDALKIIEESPERLSEIQGITPKKAEQFSRDFKQIFGMRSLMMFLSANGVNPMQSVSVYKKFGVLALELIKQNPYILCSEDLRIDFKVADKIAENSGLSKTSEERIYAGLCFVLVHNLNNGFTCLPKNRLVKVTAELLTLETETVSDCLDLQLDKKTLYSFEENTELIFLPNFYIAQKYIASRLKLMLSVFSKKVSDIDEVIEKIEKSKNIEYEELQKKAIKEASENDAFILTGGPGTGKTTTVNGIIDALERQGKTVALTAPTGRAAKRLSEVTGREAKTIHRLLEVEVGYAKTGKLQFVHNEQTPLEYDAVIVDEMSMVDTLLFDSLLRGMKPTAKLIMVGDFHQLPSVGAGNILHDLIKSDTIPMVELNHIFRQAAKSLIVTNAHMVVSGEMPDLSRNDNDFFFMARSDSQNAQTTILDLCSARLPKTYGFSSLDDIQVLSPQKKGDLGVVELNRRLQGRLNPKTDMTTEFQGQLYTFRLGDKVMQIKNNYDILWTKDGENGAGIFNGDIGIIKMIDRGSKTMAVEFDSRLCYYDFDTANEQLELAYAVTVHKSQGSEFNAIILPLMNGYSKLYYRNLLYTAITRAKKILIIIGSREAVGRMVQNNHEALRYTGMKRMLQMSVFDEEF